MDTDRQQPARGRWFASNGFGMFVLGLALAFGAAVAAQTIARAVLQARANSSIRVKGTAQVDVESDQAHWGATITAKAATLPDAYALLSTNIDALKAFMQQAGFDAEECTVGAAGTSTTNAIDARGNRINRIESYTLTQTITVHSSKVARVQAAANSVTELIRQGIEVSSGTPQYTMSSVEALKLTLLDDATRNAMRRAEMLAQGSGSRVGGLQSASQGVIQIVARGAAGGGDYNESDTGTIAKTVRAVVSLEYAVER